MLNKLPIISVLLLTILASHFFNYTQIATYTAPFQQPFPSYSYAWLFPASS